MVSGRQDMATPRSPGPSKTMAMRERERSRHVQVRGMSDRSGPQRETVKEPTTMAAVEMLET